MFKILFLLFMLAITLNANHLEFDNDKQPITMDISMNNDNLIETKDEITKEGGTNEVVTNERPKTQYYSLIFKDNRTVALDSNQKKFIDQIHLLLKKFPKKSIALISYAKGNKTPKEDLNIAKKRNAYIIDFLTKNGIDEKRISKKASSGMVAKQNVELFANSNIIEIMILEKVILKEEIKKE